ncbi:MAG TPA: VOC family protein [Gemmataceae bacterium]|nr:VOC family protein [Gemmataceae bacterium]
MNPRLTGVTPRLPVTDLGRTVAFYTRLLGFQVSALWPDDQPTFVILDRDAVSLGFFTPDALRGAVTIGTADLYIATEDVLSLHSDIKDVVPIEWGPEVYFYGRREFAVRDPDGYLLIFTEPTDDLPTCPED